MKLEEDSRPAGDDARAPAGDEPLPGADPELDAARGKRFSRLSLVGLAISVVAVAGVVYWALHQEPPQFPDEPGEWAALAGAVALYGIATLVRGERWHSLIRAERADAGPRATRTGSTSSATPRTTSSPRAPATRSACS